MAQQERKILLSFDVEEFDLPLEYHQHISLEEQLQIGYNGLQRVREVIDRPDISATMFTTAFFARHFPSDITSLSARHEIASHTYYHSNFNMKDLKSSKQELETITGQTVYGLRMPRMKKIHPWYILEAGYVYNSSINPTWVPGRYNNLRKPRTAFTDGGLIQLPVSVTPHFRIPLFWLAFKNMPYLPYLKLVLQTLKHDGHVSLYFHPWEFTDLSGYRVPGYMTKGSKEKLLHKLRQLLEHLSNEGEFMQMHKFINLKNSINTQSGR